MIKLDLEISKIGGLLVVVAQVTDPNKAAVTDAVIEVQLSRMSDGSVFDWDSTSRIFRGTPWTTKSQLIGPGQDTLHNADGLDLGAGLYYAIYDLKKTDGSLDFIDGGFYLLSSTITPSGETAIPGPAVVLEGSQTKAAAAKALNATVVLDTGVYYLVVENAAGTIVFRHPLKDVGDNNISAPTAGDNTAINAAVDPA